jgi:hypothetical protein
MHHPFCVHREPDLHSRCLQPLAGVNEFWLTAVLGQLHGPIGHLACKLEVAWSHVYSILYGSAFCSFECVRCFFLSTAGMFSCLHFMAVVL